MTIHTNRHETDANFRDKMKFYNDWSSKRKYIVTSAD